MVKRSRLESEWAGNCHEGSNPSLTAKNMKLQNLQEAKYAHGRTVERVLKFFSMEKMHYGPGGQEEPVYIIKPDFVAQFGTVNDYSVYSIQFGEGVEGKYAWVNNGENYLLDWFLENIEIFKKSKVL